MTARSDADLKALILKEIDAIGGKNPGAREHLMLTLGPRDPDVHLESFYESAGLRFGRLTPLPGVTVPTREEYDEAYDRFVDIMDEILDES